MIFGMGSGSFFSGYFIEKGRRRALIIGTILGIIGCSIT